MKCVRWRAAGGERLARPFANHAGLKLGDTRHLLQRKPAGCAFDGRHVDEANLDVCGEELRQEGDGSSERRWRLRVGSQRRAAEARGRLAAMPSAPRSARLEVDELRV
jgi:hypothetical protein